MAVLQSAEQVETCCAHGRGRVCRRVCRELQCERRLLIAVHVVLTAVRRAWNSTCARSRRHELSAQLCSMHSTCTAAHPSRRCAACPPEQEACSLPSRIWMELLASKLSLPTGTHGCMTCSWRYAAHGTFRETSTCMPCARQCAVKLVSRSVVVLACCIARAAWAHRHMADFHGRERAKSGAIKPSSLCFRPSEHEPSSRSARRMLRLYTC